MIACRRLVAVVAWLAIPASTVRAQAAFAQEAKLVASSRQRLAYLGWSVSVSGETVVVGSILDDSPQAASAGSAYVFVRSGTTWTEQQKLTASDGASGDYFGTSVSVSGDTMVVGAYLDDVPGSESRGSAYVYVRSGTTWTEQQKLTASDGAASDYFGVSVSISGDTVVIGAPGDDSPAGEDAGAAYVFTRSGTTWTEQQKLTSSQASPVDFYGNTVAASGDTIVVGAPGDDTPGGPQAGAAYVFVRSGTTWTEQQRLTAPDGAALDQLGASVSVSGDTVVAGAPGADAPGGPDQGWAYVFVRSGTSWTQQQKLTASDGEVPGSFGSPISVSGDTMVVGAREDVGPGAAYVFVRSGTVWTEQQKLNAPEGAAFDYFGSSVSVSGDTVVVGEPFDDIAGVENVGSAYVFRPPAPAAYFTVTPCRVVDTRTSGPALAANSTRTLAVAGLCQVPTGARAVAAIVVAVNPGDLGNLRVYAAGQPPPLASTLNFAAGRTRANNAILRLGPAGQATVQCDMPPGSLAATHLVVDVFGYFE